MRHIPCAALCLQACLQASLCWAAPLPALHATLTESSVSGVSSGGFMAVQIGVAHSKIIRGVGVIAAGPYYCAEGSISIALSGCVNGVADVDPLIAITRAWALAGLIDAPGAIAQQRIWLFSGTNDSVVKPVVVQALEKYYSAFVARANIRSVSDVGAAHGFVTDNFGSACDKAGGEFIVNCGFDAAGEILKQIYGELKPRKANPTGRLIEFAQREFASPGRAGTLAERGYAFVPADCASGKSCRVHVALHGCEQSAANIGNAFYTKAGYNAWADANSIIVLYPQIEPSTFFPMNPLGCWDWWGYTGADYAQKSGAQIHAIRAMLDRLAGKGAEARK